YGIAREEFVEQGHQPLFAGRGVEDGGQLGAELPQLRRGVGVVDEADRPLGVRGQVHAGVLHENHRAPAVRAPGRHSSGCRTRSRKVRVRSCRGSPITWEGGPSSTMTPPSMNTTRSATWRAKPISWVTTSMVMPSSASLRMTAST